MSQIDEDKVLFAHRFDGTAETVRATLLQACRALQGAGVDQDTLGSIELVLAEALNNVVEHAFVGVGKEPVSLCLLRLPGRIRMEIHDRGIAFPGGVLPRSPQRSLADLGRELPEGGFGWLLLTRLVQEIHYVRIDGENRLTLDVSMDWSACGAR